MNFDDEILKVLTLAGDCGLKTEKIARHVFNACNSMFNPLDYKDVHSYVTQYLIKNAKDSLSIIEKGRGHGIYRLNFQAKLAQQLVLKFTAHDDDTNEQETTSDKDQTEDLSLSLFG